MRRVAFVCLAVVLFVPTLLLSRSVSVRGASSYANPAFQAQWQQGESLTPNFWGPLGTAHDGQMEPYADVPGGQRLVQYFDKGRMELRNGVVTNGLLAGEIVRAQVQVGDATFQSKDPPAIPIAGDNDNPGPTYAHLSGVANALLQTSPAQPGADHIVALGSDGTVMPGVTALTGNAALKSYDMTTQHNVPGVFADYRDKAGLATIGFALSEPFGATVKVAGQPRAVLIQVFERRVLTYTADNPPAFQVEMGNIGQHYYQWRYTGAPVGGGGGPASVAAMPPPPTATTAAGPTTQSPATARSTVAVTLRGPLPAVATLPVGTVPAGLSLPSSQPSLNTFPSPPAYTGPIYKCSDFPSQAVAQAYLRLYPTDPSHLDPNKTGIACPTNAAPTDQARVARR